MINTGRGLARVALILALFAAALLTFPGDYQPVSPGLDPSWMWGINAFPLAGFRFGQDVIFTYGPIGYLLRPLEVGSNLGHGTLLRLAVHLIIFGGLSLLLVRRRRTASVISFLVAFVCLTAFELEFDYQLLVAAVFLIALATELDRPALLVLPGAACAALLFMKFGTGVSALCVVLAGCALWTWRRGGARGPLALAASYLLTFTVLSAGLFGSLRGLAAFLRLSFEIARGYNDAMSVSGPARPVVGALAVTAALAWVTFRLARRSAPAAAPLLLLAVPLLLGFKHGFVRQDWGHEPFVFGIALAAAVFALAFAEGTRERWLLAATGIAILVVFLASVDRRATDARRAAFGNVVRGVRGWVNIDALVHWNRTRAELREASRADLKATDTLPRSWREEIGTHPVLVLPSELTLCEANALPCVPYPTLQMFATYTRTLDLWSAERLVQSSPEFVIAEVGAVDGRNMIWDCPRTWLALITGWDVVGRSDLHPRLLLRRRERATSISETLLANTQGTIGQWNKAPPTSGRLQVSIAARETLFGRVRRALFRADPVILQVSFPSARALGFRLVLETARSGVLLDPVVTTVGDLSALFAGQRGEPVQAIRLSGPGARWLEPDLELTWVSLASDQAAAQVPRPDLQAHEPADPPLVAIDSVNGRPARQPVLIDAATEGVLAVSGWAVDAPAGRAASRVFLSFDDGALEVPTDYGGDRADVATVFEQPGYRFSGFSGGVALSALPPGTHRMRLRVVFADGRHTALSTEVVTLEVR